MASKPQESPRNRNSPHQKAACTRCRVKKKRCEYTEPNSPCKACRKRDLTNECQFVPDGRSGRLNASSASTPIGSLHSPQAPTDLQQGIAREVDTGAAPVIPLSASSVPALPGPAVAEPIALFPQSRRLPLPTQPDNYQRLEADLADFVQGVQGAISLLRVILQSPSSQTAERRWSQAFPFEQSEQSDSQAPSWLAHAAPLVAGSFEESPYLPQSQSQQDTFLPISPQHPHSIAIPQRGSLVQDDGPMHQSPLHVSLPPQMGDISSLSTMLIPHVSGQDHSQPRASSPGHRMVSVPQLPTDQLGGIDTIFENVRQPAHPTIPQMPHVIGPAVGLSRVPSLPTASGSFVGNLNQSWTLPDGSWR